MFGIGLGLADAAVVLRRSADGGTVQAPLAVARPPFAIAQPWNLWGDSTTFGVGAPGGSDYPQLLRTMAAAGGGAPAGVACHLGAPNDGTRTGVCNGGVSAENSAGIGARVATLAGGSNAAEMQRPQIFSGGLNNYNAGVPGWSRNWPAQVLSDLGLAATRIGGGRDWFHILAPSEDNRSDGMVEGASHVHHRRAMTAAHDRRILNFQRYARDHPDPAANSGYDIVQAGTNGAIPISLRGTSTSAATPAYRDTPPIVVAGAPTDLTQDDGQIAWNSTALTIHRKLGASGGGSWQAVDIKHLSASGNALMARMVGDAMMASEGTGPPLASPCELLTTVDVPVGEVVGRLPHTGTATTMALTVDRAGTVPLPGLAIAADGTITRAATGTGTGTGTATATATGAGTLLPGMQTVYAWTGNAAGTLRTPLDLYVDAATGAPPARFTVGGTGIALYGRESHGFPNGQQIAGAMLVRVDTLATTPFLVNLTRGPGGQTSFAVKVLSDGRLSFVGNNNSATTTLGVNLIMATGQGIAAGAWTWILFSLDFAAGTASMWFNDTARTLGAFPGSGAAGGTFNFSDTSPLFYAARPPQQLDDGLNVLKGGFGPLLLFAGAIDWSVATHRRALFDIGGLPVARTPFSPVAGVVPHFDTSGGIGRFLWGCADPTNPQTLLVPSWRARSLLAVVG